MKHFLIILLACVPFFASSQDLDTMVVIKPNTARYFLEVDDKLKVYEVRDSLNQQLIDNLSTQLKLKDDQISLYELDQLGYETMIETKTLEIESLNKQNRRLRRGNRLLKVGVVGGFIAGLLLAR